MKIMSTSTAGGAWDNYGGYNPEYDDMWLEGGDDDWVHGEGARFGDDEYHWDPYSEGVSTSFTSSGNRSLFC